LIKSLSARINAGMMVVKKKYINLLFETVRKASGLSLFLLLVLFNLSCKTNEDYPLTDIIEKNNPVSIIGTETENLNDADTPIYKLISHYYVDDKNNIYIGDAYGRKIDKYDKNGKFLHSIGRPGQGPGEFNVVPFFAVGKEGKIVCAYKKIQIFDQKGHYLKSFDFEEPYGRKHVVKIKMDKKNNVYFLFYIRPYVYELVKTDLSFSNYQFIHKDKNRIDDENKVVSGLAGFTPDFCIDSNGAIYVTDTVDYKIYKYSGRGDLLNAFEKSCKRIKIDKDDLIFPTFKGNEIQHLPHSLLDNLYGPHKYFPSIFGINIEDGKIFIWTSKQDSKKQFFIDIYNLKWNLTHKSAHVNNIKKNYIRIKNGKLYSPNIDSPDLDFKKQLSRFAYFNAPYKLLVFDLLL
jgi:hypothetical protein